MWPGKSELTPWRTLCGERSWHAPHLRGQGVDDDEDNDDNDDDGDDDD